MSLAPGKLTTSSNEDVLQKVLGGDVVFQIPYFQRPYKWRKAQLELLERDIEDLIDGRSSHHFLGAIIVHGRKSNPSEASPYDVIDGQQRITTVFLYICAAIKSLCKNEKYDDAASYFKKFVCVSEKGTFISNIKIHPSGEDRRQMNMVVADVTSNLILKEKIGQFFPEPLPNTGAEIGPLIKNYKHACKYFDSIFQSGGAAALLVYLSVLLQQVSVVQIDLIDPSSAPKIFDSLNSRQEPMTIGDLVRNDIFARVANTDYAQAEKINKIAWEPFYEKFKFSDRNHFDEYFFPFGLVHNPNVSKSDVFRELRSRWATYPSPIEVIADLQTYQNAFLDIVRGTNLQVHGQALASSLKRVSAYGAPASVYPFLMCLSEAARKNEIEVSDATEMVELVENFLVRRALSGIEPTGLHAVFKRLWDDCKDERTAKRVEAVIRAYPTVVWATDDQVIGSLTGRSLAKSIRLYFIREYDRSLPGDSPTNQVWIEHVLPQKPDSEWNLLFSKEQQKSLLNMAGNLIPLTSEMNRDLSNGPYANKRPKYRAGSAFKSARVFADRYEIWSPEELAARNSELAQWAVTRWLG